MVPQHNSLATNAQAAGQAASMPAPDVRMTYPGAYILLTRDDVCRILGGISLRTLENWVRQGKVPAPDVVGGRRLWQPARFYEELDQIMLAQRAERCSSLDQGAKPQAPKREQAATHPAAVGTVSRSAQACEEMKRRALSRLA